MFGIVMIPCRGSDLEFALGPYCIRTVLFCSLGHDLGLTYRYLKGCFFLFVFYFWYDRIVFCCCGGGGAGSE